MRSDLAVGRQAPLLPLFGLPHVYAGSATDMIDLQPETPVCKSTFVSPLRPGILPLTKNTQRIARLTAMWLLLHCLPSEDQGPHAVAHAPVTMGRFVLILPNTPHDRIGNYRFS